MKKAKWGLLIAALVVCLLAVGCGGKDASDTDDQTATSGEAAGSDESDESKEKGEPYEFTFVSNGDGTCYISGVRFNEEFADEELTLTFPEKSPAGDTVTAVRYQVKENAVPMVISDEDFLQYILQPIMVAEGKEPVQSTDVLSSSQMSAEQYKETLSFAARQLSAFYGGRDGKRSLALCEDDGQKYAMKKKYPFLQEHPDMGFWVFDLSAAETQIERENEYLMTIGMTPAKALQAEQRVGWASSSEFAYPDNVIAMEFPETVTEISKSVFFSISLQSLSLPDGVKVVGDTNGWSIFKSTPYYNDDSNWTDNVLYIGSVLVACKEDTTGSVTIKDGTTCIANSAFVGCNSLESVIIPDSVTDIGDSAFYECASLTSVTIGNSVTSIGAGAFHDCTGLTGVYITDIASWCNISFSDNPLEYAHNLYLNGELVTSVVIPDGVTYIAGSAFAGCTNLTSVVIPNSVTSIGGAAFWDCTGLTSITIPDSVTYIGESAFEGCSGLTSITIPDSVTYIGESAFAGCSGLTSITVPYVGATRDGDWYTNFGYLFGAYEPDDNSAYVPSSLKTVVVTGGTGIGEEAFSGCTGLESITIGNGVTSIGGRAFSGCTGLTSITIGNGVTSIGGRAFSDTAYYNDESNWTDGVLYIDHALIDCKEDKTGAVTIKDGTKCIADYAFKDCKSLTSIIIPNSVTSIGEDLFWGCSDLTNITFAGTKAQWKAIEKAGTASFTVHCTDGDIAYEDA